MMIKKLIFLLIPIIGFCQTPNFSLDELKSITNINEFEDLMKKKGINNKERVSIGYYDVTIHSNDLIKSNISGVDSYTPIEGFFNEDDSYMMYLSFNSNNDSLKNNYNELFSEVKMNCKYLKKDRKIMVKSNFRKYGCGDEFQIGFGEDKDELLIVIY